MSAKDFLVECQSRAVHGCICYQSITGYSIEIYTGYKKSYKNLFYTDGHTSIKSALKKAKKYFKDESSK